ncbi:MAG: hypothetical protein LBK58_03705 [Prevotellaceae bacterium]|jgi:hypothetical protein|nr:hypothetical protein [Prevotellaceae bacterium]
MKLTGFIGSIILVCSIIPASAQTAANSSRPEWQKKYDTREVRKMFANPPMFYAPHTFWFWDDTIRDEHYAASMAKEMSRQRLNPGYAHPRSGFSRSVTSLPPEQYLAKPWFSSFGNTLQAAKENGMSFAYCDDYNWPSGQAAGRVLEQHPELEAKHLVWTRYEVNGGTDVSYSPVDFAVAGKVIDKKIDCSSLVIIGEGDSISWTAPEGNWAVYTYEKKHHPGVDGGKVNYIDNKLMDVFIPLVHEQYAGHFGRDMGKTISGVFVDNEGDYGWRMAWSEYFARQYMLKKGRDIRLWLPLLTEEDRDGIYVKARYDWFDVVSDVYTECYMEPLVTWLKKRNMYYISNLWEESLMLQTAAVGDLMRTTRAVTMPGNDCLEMRSQDVHDFKEVQSVAEFEDRPFMSEIMGVAGWEQTPEQMKMTVNSVISFGINHVVPHGIYMNRRLETVPFPSDWFTGNPYWQYLHCWTDFTRRASFVTRQSRLVADVLLIHPLESVWAFSENCFRDAKAKDHWDERAVKVNSVYSDAMRMMNRENIDFLIGDKYYLEKGKTGFSGEQAKITVNSHDFYAMVVPPLYVISRSSFGKILEFAKNGGTVILLGELPQGSPEYGMNDALIMEQEDALRKLPGVIDLAGEDRVQEAMTAALKAKLKPQISLENAGRLYTAHRTLGDMHLYWLANNTDTVKNFTARLRNGEGMAEIWNCETGQIQTVPSGRENGYNRVSLTLNPYEGYWLAFNPRKKALKGEPPANPSSRETVLDGKWMLSCPEQDTVAKTTAKVLYSDDQDVDEGKLQPDCDDSEWQYYSKRANLKDYHAYWRMNVPVGAKSVVLPAYMSGRDIWIDGKKLRVSDTLIRLPSGARLLGFVMNLEEQKSVPAPFRFLVEPAEIPGLQSWYACGLQQYTGYVDYETTVTLDNLSAKMSIDLGKVKYVAEVFINRQSAGARLWFPFTFDISGKLKRGENKIRIRVGNLITNRMWMEDDMNKLRLWRWHGIVPDMNLFDSGISGPVRIIYY